MRKHIRIHLNGSMIRMRLPLFFFLALACIGLLTGLLPGFSDSAEGVPEVGVIREVGELKITSNTTSFNDEALLVTGNITIENGASLTLSGCNITMNSTQNQKFGIHVKAGGYLSIKDTNLNASMGGEYFFSVNGTLTTDNATILDVYNSLDSAFSGINIGSANVTINNTIIYNRWYYSWALNLDNSTVSITNSRISVEYMGVLARNTSLTMQNTTIFTTTNAGYGVISVGSEIDIYGCSIYQSAMGIAVYSGISVRIENCLFAGNGYGIVQYPFSNVTPEIFNCTFEGNQLSAMYLYGSANISSCIIRNNVLPGVIQPVAAIMLESDGQGNGFTIQDTEITGNHNGLLMMDVSVELINCTITNNTLFEGTAGMIIYGPLENDTVTIRDCTVTDQPVGIDIGYVNILPSLIIENTIFWNNSIAIRSVDSLIACENSMFTDNELAIEERYRDESVWTGNAFMNNTLDRRFKVEVYVHVEDGYGEALKGAFLVFRSSLSSPSRSSPLPSSSSRFTSLPSSGRAGDDGYAPNFTTLSTGNISLDLIWYEVMMDDGSEIITEFHPFTVEVMFEDAEAEITLSEIPEDTIQITVPFLRPDLIVYDLKFDNQGFSLWDEDPHADQTTYIKFKIKNIGLGATDDATVVVKAGNRNLLIEKISLDPGERKEFKVKWNPDLKGKINISVKVSDPDELNATENSQIATVNVGEDQRGYYYLIVLVTALVISALVWWMVVHIEETDDSMAEITQNLKKKLANLFDSWSRSLRTDDEIPEDQEQPFIPTEDIYTWDGDVKLSGSGRYHPWNMEDENTLREKNPDVMTIRIKIPIPEVALVDEDVPEMETFEWVTAKGKKEQIQVDKRTLTKLSHPKMFICKNCDRNFVSVEPGADCPWCAGTSLFLEDL